MKLAPGRSLRGFNQTPVRILYHPSAAELPECLFLSDLVQEGISEKVSMAVQFMSSFIAGFILAYTQSWRLALAISSVLPCIMLTGALMGKFMTRYTQ